MCTSVVLPQTTVCLIHKLLAHFPFFIKYTDLCMLFQIHSSTHSMFKEKCVSLWQHHMKVRLNSSSVWLCDRRCSNVPSRCPCESESWGHPPPSLDPFCPPKHPCFRVQWSCPSKISSPPAAEYTESSEEVCFSNNTEDFFSVMTLTTNLSDCKDIITITHDNMQTFGDSNFIAIAGA